MWRNCITCPVHVPSMSRLKNIVVKESGFSLTTIFVFEQNVLFWRSVVNGMGFSLTTVQVFDDGTGVMLFC
jgi:hypothetical protein